MPVKEQGFSLLEVLIAMAISSVLLLGAATICPDHHDHTRDNHRDGKNLPHADVLHPGTSKLRVGLAEKLNNDAKRAVTNQEQA